jgi:glycosyltransferase 2 family protein
VTARLSGRPAAPGRPARLPSAGSVVRLVVAVGLTAFILWKSDPALVWGIAAGARPAPLLAAVLLVVVDRTLMAWRWLWLLVPFAARPADGSRPPVGRWDVLHVFFVSSFVGTFLPASVGADAVRATSLARMGVPMADAVASVFMDRVLGVLGVLAMGAAGLYLARDLPDLGRAVNASVLVALAVTALGCAAVAAAVFSARVAARLIALVQYLPWAKAHAAGSAVVGAVQRYASHHGLLGAVTLASIGVQVLRVLQAWCLGLGLGIAVPLPTYFAFIPIILLVMLLPVTVNGLGTSQAAFVLFFAAAGVGKPEAFALSVLFVALGIVGNLPGGILWTRSGLTPAPATPLADAPTPRGPA